MLLTLLRLVLAALCLLHPVVTSVIPFPTQSLDASGASLVSLASRQIGIPNDLPKLPGWVSIPRNTTSLSAIVLGTGNALQPSPVTFGGICDGVRLTGSGKVGQASIEGRCVDGKGFWWDTVLNLNKCVANEGGILKYHPEGHFDENCRPCALTNHDQGSEVVLKCSCKNDEGQMSYTILQMGYKANHTLSVKPVNGQFVCGLINGSKAPASVA